MYLTGSNTNKALWSAILAVSGLAGLIAGASVIRILTVHLGHDQSWGLYCAEQMMRGITLDGVMLVEVNPPFLIWFMVIPVYLSKLLHISLTGGYQTFEISLFILMGTWAAYLFSRFNKQSMLSIWVFTLLVAYLAAFSLQSDDIGQREHLVTFLLLPYLFVSAMRIAKDQLPGRLHLGLVGFSSGVAVCLKPQHVVEIFLLELFVLTRVRSFRFFNYTAGLLCLLTTLTYVLVARVIVPSYFSAIIPMLTATYWGFNQSLLTVLEGVEKPLALAFAVVLLYVLLRNKLQNKALHSVFIVAAIGALVAYVQQHKGWSYQSICFKDFILILFALIVTDLFESAVTVKDIAASRKTPLLPPTLTAIGMLVVSLVYFSHHWRLSPITGKKGAIAEIYAEYPTKTHVGLLSVDPWQFPAITEQNKIWSSRYMHLWMIPALVRSEDPLEPDKSHNLSPMKLSSLSSLLRLTTAEDLALWQPEVVVVDPCGMANVCLPLSRERYGNLIGWFTVEPRFRTEWSHYTLVKSVGGLEVYVRDRKM